MLATWIAPYFLTLFALVRWEALNAAERTNKAKANQAFPLNKARVEMKSKAIAILLIS